ncbi:hypothetical protein MY04_2784 [Flammeovirga sp. MY04]|uniref:hypothetical protein n=1 Tax=Flammeovirga sp. MY04 TaxID=1191459 RepID=UPI0008064176|nr:hypothetical protein [Flammeovirga sp. MY04]ANQ50152.1 hypothetical protein MY04_2784 [Flammeovirga sp. MY04]
MEYTQKQTRKKNTSSYNKTTNDEAFYQASYDHNYDYKANKKVALDPKWEYIQMKVPVKKLLIYKKNKKGEVLVSRSYNYREDLLMVNRFQQFGSFYQCKLIDSAGDKEICYVKVEDTKNYYDNGIIDYSIMLPEVSIILPFHNGDNTVLNEDCTLYQNTGNITHPVRGKSLVNLKKDTVVKVGELADITPENQCVEVEVVGNVDGKVYQGVVEVKHLLKTLVPRPNDANCRSYKVKEGDTIGKIVADNYKWSNKKDEKDIRYYAQVLLFVNNPDNIQKGSAIGIYTSESTPLKRLMNWMNFSHSNIIVNPNVPLWIPSQEFADGLYDKLPKKGDFTKDWGDRLYVIETLIKDYWIEGLGYGLGANIGAVFGFIEGHIEGKTFVHRDGEHIYLKKMLLVGAGVEVGAGAGFKCDAPAKNLGFGGGASADASLKGSLYGILEYKIPLTIENLIAYLISSKILSGGSIVSYLISYGIEKLIALFLDNYTAEPSKVLQRAVLAYKVDALGTVGAQVGATTKSTKGKDFEAKDHSYTTTTYSGTERKTDVATIAKGHELAKNLTDNKAGELILTNMLPSQLGLSANAFLGLGFEVGGDLAFDQKGDNVTEVKAYLQGYIKGGLSLPMLPGIDQDVTVGIEFIFKKKNDEINFNSLNVFIQKGETEWYNGQSSIHKLKFDLKSLYILSQVLKNVQSVADFANVVFSKGTRDKLINSMINPSFLRYQVPISILTRTLKSEAIQKKIQKQLTLKHSLPSDYNDWGANINAYFDLDFDKANVQVGKLFSIHVLGSPFAEITDNLCQLILDGFQNCNFQPLYDELVVLINGVNKEKIFSFINAVIQGLIEGKGWNFRIEGSLSMAAGAKVGAGLKGQADGSATLKVFWQTTDNNKADLAEVLSKYFNRSNLLNFLQINADNDDNKLYNHILENMTLEL